MHQAPVAVVEAEEPKEDITEVVGQTIEGFDILAEKKADKEPSQDEEEQQDGKDAGPKLKGKKSKKVDDTDDVDAGEGGVAEATIEDLEELEWEESDLPNQFESWNSLTNNDKDKLIKMHRMMNKEKKARDLQTIKKNMGAAVKDANARLNKEETEQVNEISDDMKKRYITKANKEITRREKTRLKPGLSSLPQDKDNKRRKGVAQARSNLNSPVKDQNDNYAVNKEEINSDMDHYVTELSSLLKKRYVKKASKEIKLRTKVADQHRARKQPPASIINYHDTKIDKRKKGIYQAKEEVATEATAAQVFKARYSSDNTDDTPHNTSKTGPGMYKSHAKGSIESKKGKTAALKKQHARRPKDYQIDGKHDPLYPANKSDSPHHDRKYGGSGHNNSRKFEQTESTLKGNLLNILKSNAFDLVNDKKVEIASFGDFKEAYSRKSVINSKDRHTGADDHIVMQLRNAQDLGGKKKVKFHTGDSKGNKHHELHPDHIKKVLDWHDHPQRTPREKRMLRVGIKSHDHFKRVAKAIK